MMAKDVDEPVNLEAHFDRIEGVDGKIYYALHTESAEILGRYIQTQKWWNETVRRIKKASLIWGALVGGLTSVFLIWPQIEPFAIRIAQWFLDRSGGAQ